MLFFLSVSSMVLSGVSVFLILVVQTRVQNLIVTCLFSGISVIGWNTLDVLGTELFPTHLRWVHMVMWASYLMKIAYCRTHNVSICLYIAYIACSSTSLYIKMLYVFLTVLALSAVATVANIKIRYDVKTPQFAIFETRVICVFYSIKMQQVKHI